MDYSEHYKRLCERAKNRKIDSYVENHHIEPRCMGGDDSKENIVALTPEEHYVAHQLLVKMYPNHTGLIWAALLMTGDSENDHRSNNKVYGWLKQKHQKVAKSRIGKKNGSYGRSWYYHPDTMDNIKCLPDEIPDGYVKGRKIKPPEKLYKNTHSSKCKICGQNTESLTAKYCKTHRIFAKKKMYKLKTKATDDDLKNALLKTDMNKSEALKKVGYTITGKNWHRIKKVSEKLIKENPELKQKQEEIDNRGGEKNGNYGKSWYYEPETLNSVLCYPEDAPKGYTKGRIIKY